MLFSQDLHEARRLLDELRLRYQDESFSCSITTLTIPMLSLCDDPRLLRLHGQTPIQLPILDSVDGEPIDPVAAPALVRQSDTDPSGDDMDLNDVAQQRLRVIRNLDNVDWPDPDTTFATFASTTFPTFSSDSDVSRQRGLVCRRTA